MKPEAEANALQHDAVATYRISALGRGRAWLCASLALLAVVLCPAQSIAAPAAGDVLVYQVINAYNKQQVGTVRHEIAGGATAQGQAVSISVDKAALGVARTEILSGDGLWLRRTLDNHGVPVEYEFSPALPAVQASLGAGQSWSTRVSAQVPSANARRSVRVDGWVLGNERIRVPAGEFDTIKIRRVIYPGDAGDFKTETRIYETDWYAPALGRSVRTETRSDWRQNISCRRGYCDYRGDWLIYELSEAKSGH